MIQLSTIEYPSLDKLQVDPVFWFNMGSLDTHS